MNGKIGLGRSDSRRDHRRFRGASLAGMGDGGDHMGDGSVARCSLDGIDPAHHPEIFRNPAVAASYGFLRSRDGSRHVVPKCRR